MLTRSRMWSSSLFHQRLRSLIATAAGIAVTVALLATMFGFIASTQRSMTQQAIADVPIDWQVQLAPGTDLSTAAGELKSSPGAERIAEVGFAASRGFETTADGTTQTTGPGKVLGIPDDYRTLFPTEIRDLIGQGQVLLAQQTAANLHATPGSKVTIYRPGAGPVQVTVDAIVDLPQADSLFQNAGAPVGSAPQAPPDNVLILPLDRWHQLFDPVAAVDPSAVSTQLHVSLPHHLPASPSSAYVQVTGMARNYEARLGGAAIVGDNLAARLDAARSDALYAGLLFFFLGSPGIVLACLLTALVVSATAGARRRDQALLRLRGASQPQVLLLTAGDALVTGLLGGAAGIALGLVMTRLTFHRWEFGNGAAGTLRWGIVAAAAGLALACAVIVLPAWWDYRTRTVDSARRVVERNRRPIWERIGLDFLLLAAGGMVYWNAKRHGYQVLLAPEGVPRVTVSYTSLLAPLLIWTGGALLVVRCIHLLLSRNGTRIAGWLQPISGSLSSFVGAALSRDRAVLARSVALVALAIAFASSTAIFNATYAHQSLVDAQLTNGADVAVHANPGTDLAANVASIGHVPGVVAAEPMQHRFAYVGTDLQDLYGIDPASIERAAALSDAYFVGASTRDTLNRLAATPDGVLVSPETVSDFQLQPGDTINLRLQSAADHQYHPVPFRYVGIAREFPTAPSDSFLVANAAYVAQQTGQGSMETILIKTDTSPAAVADRIRTLLGPTTPAMVGDIEATRQVIRTSLTAVSLHGLTRIELGLAILLAVAGAGLVFVLSQDERRRTLAIVSAIGATRRQLGAFVWAPAILIVLSGIAFGLLLGTTVAYLLVKLLTHVFDPPPQHAIVPWPYLIVVLAATALAIAAGARTVIESAQRRRLEAIRRL